MATAVYADPEPQSLQALKHRLRKTWKSISLSTLHKKLSYCRETARQLPT